MSKERLNPPSHARPLRIRFLHVAFAMTALVCSSLSEANAQDDGCTYDECALRMSGGEVRRGLADERVDGFSFFGTSIDLPMLAERSDSAGINYEAFRKLNSRANWFHGTAAVLAVGGLIATVADQDSPEWGLGLTLAGCIPLFIGGSYHRKSIDRLQRAIWWYNREL